MDRLPSRNRIDEEPDCYAGPITGNAKCIVISFALAAGYWFAPHRNKWVLVGILYFTYLCIAWYDYWYDCRANQFGPTYLQHFYDFAKPQDSDQNKKYRNLCPDLARKILYVDIVVAVILLMLLPRFLAWTP